MTRERAPCGGRAIRCREGTRSWPSRAADGGTRACAGEEGRMGSQEISKPVAVAVIAVAVIVIGLIGWYFMRPQKYPGFQAPPGAPGMGGTRMIPGQEPGRMYPPPSAPR